jgi:hypothetical protein
LAELGRYYDSLNEYVIPRVKNAAPRCVVLLRTAFERSSGSLAELVFAAYLPRKKGLPPVRSGAIMKLQ